MGMKKNELLLRENQNFISIHKAMSSNTFLASESINDVDHARQEEEREREPPTT